MDFGPRLGTTSDPYYSPVQQVQYGQYLKITGLIAEYYYQNYKIIKDTMKLSGF